MCHAIQFMLHRHAAVQAGDLLYRMRKRETRRKGNEGGGGGGNEGGWWANVYARSTATSKKGVGVGAACDSVVC